MSHRHFLHFVKIILLLALFIPPNNTGFAETVSDVTPPVLITNTGLRLTPGASGIISTTILRVENGSVPAERLFYTLQSMPLHGTLTRNNVPLAQGDAFTQAEIDAGQIRYTHDGDTANQDNLQFILSHGPLIQRVSTAGDGTPLSYPVPNFIFNLSGDGRYFVFHSDQIVVPMSYNGKNNIFRRDLETGAIGLISRGVSGALSNNDSILPFASYDGRYVAFASNASNLITDSTVISSDYHIYRYDTQLQIMEKVDSFPLGLTTAGLLTQGISADGQVILYAGDIPGQGSAVYAFDFSTKTESLITSLPVNYGVGSASISADGRFIATYNGWLFERGTQNRWSIPPQNDFFSLSGDGRYLAFIGAYSLAPGDNNGAKDVLVYDRVANTYELISSPNFEPGPYGTNAITPTISADGRFVAYAAYQTMNGIQNLHLIVYDRVLKTDRVVSTSAAGQPGSLLPSLSAQGERLAFYSQATNLVQDGSSEPGYYVRQLLSSPPQTFSISIDQNKYFYLPVIQTSG